MSIIIFDYRLVISFLNEVLYKYENSILRKYRYAHHRSSYYNDNMIVILVGYNLLTQLI